MTTFLLLLVYFVIGCIVMKFINRIFGIGDFPDENLDIGMIVLMWPVVLPAMIIGFAVTLMGFIIGRMLKI